MKTAIITGCNKGIGYGLLKYLAGKEHDKWKILAAIRNIEDHNIKKINQISIANDKTRIQIQELNIADFHSISSFVQKLSSKNQKIDLLINNAGVTLKTNKFDVQSANFVLNTNYYGTKNLTQLLIPHLNQRAKIITLGSSAGKRSYLKMPESLSSILKQGDISTKKLDQFIKKFVCDIQNNKYIESGWPKQIYGISKLGINTFNYILGKDQNILKREIQVYACCPGFVKTDMVSHFPNFAQFQELQDGLQTPKMLIDLPFQLNLEFQGGFFQKKRLGNPFS